MIKGVIFDMDGVIFDSETVAMDLAKQIMPSYGRPFDFDVYKQLIGINQQRAVTIMAEYFKDIDLADRFLNEFRIALQQSGLQGNIPLKKGAMELINWLNEHRIPIVLATSSNLPKVNGCFKGNGYSTPFKYIITGEQVTNSKPNPEIFLKAADMIHQDIHNCLIIEDSYNGIKAAIDCGSISCMVPDLLEPTEWIKENVNFIKKDLLEVLELIKEDAILSESDS